MHMEVKINLHKVVQSSMHCFRGFFFFSSFFYSLSVQVIWSIDVLGMEKWFEEDEMDDDFDGD